MEPSAINAGTIPLIGIMVTIVLAAIAFYKSMTAIGESVRRELHSRIDKTENSQDSARASERAAIQIILTRYDTDLDRMKREMVRQDEMRHLEGRLIAQVGKVEAQVGKVDDKVDRIGASAAALEATSEQNAERLERLLDRIENGQPLPPRTRMTRQETP